MYLKLLKLLITTSKRALYMFLVQVLAMQLLIAESSKSQKLENVKVTIKVEQAPLDEVFEELEKETEFTFGYNKRIISKRNKFSVNYQDESLNKILENISRDTGLKFRMINKTISVTAKENEQQAIEVIAADVDVSGKITDENGQGLPGASVIIKGTSSGATTDLDGNYKFNAPEESTLVISYVGYVTIETALAGRNVVDVQLALDAGQLEEVVVTAFGLKRDKKAITYAAQTVKTDEMKSARPLNVTSGLSGKVAGLSVTQGANGVGSPTRVLLRGNRSITGNSQPIYIVDGVNLGDDISNISPDDIESVSILRGPNAAALYGNRANNGAIVITTKSGNGSEGSTVSVNTSFMTSSAVILWDFQNEYAQGIDGTYSGASTTSWGPRMTGQSVAHWSNDPNSTISTYDLNAQPDNVKDFYQTGYNLSTNIAVSTTKKNSQSYFSYTLTDAEGIVPNNTLKRHNVNIRASQKVFEKFTLDTKLNYIRSNFDNQVYTGENFANPNRQALRLPRNIRTADASQFEFLNTDGTIDQHYWKPGDNGGANPYWTINRNNNTILDERVIGLISLKYEFTEELSLQARSAIDRTSFYREDNWYNDSYIIAPLGRFTAQNEVRSEWNSDALLNFKKDFSSLTVDVSLGTNLRVERLQGNTVAAGTNSGLNLENIFALSNIAAPELTEVFNRREVQSVYAFGQFGYNGYLFIDASFRNDWSSTLPEANRSFNYPSLGLTAVISDMIDLPGFFTFTKLRVNYAKVGGDTDPYRLARRLNLLPGGSGGILDPDLVLPEENLLPEETTSTEFGLDFRFLDDRIGLDFTYYKSNSTNQLFDTPVPVASGVASVFQNGGDIENKGIEFVLRATPIKNSDLTWDIAFNFGKNQSKVLSITEGFDEIGIPDGGPFWGRIVARVGSPYGEFFSRGFVRDDSGNVIVDANGLPQVTPGTTVSLGDFNPSWLGGISNQVSYKNFNLSFLIDIRQGGKVSSFTEAVLAGDGLLESTIAGREGGVFGVDIYPDETAVTEAGATNTIQTTAQDVFAHIGGRNAPTGEGFVKDASNGRLRELVLGYSMPQSMLDNLPFTSLDFSIVGRNLFFLWNSAGQFDPEVFPTIGSGQAGFNSFATPTSRNIGFNLTFTF